MVSIGKIYLGRGAKIKMFFSGWLIMGKVGITTGSVIGNNATRQHGEGNNTTRPITL